MNFLQGAMAGFGQQLAGVGAGFQREEAAAALERQRSAAAMDLEQIRAENEERKARLVATLNETAATKAADREIAGRKALVDYGNDPKVQEAAARGVGAAERAKRRAHGVTLRPGEEMTYEDENGVQVTLKNTRKTPQEVQDDLYRDALKGDAAKPTKQGKDPDIDKMLMTGGAFKDAVTGQVDQVALNQARLFTGALMDQGSAPDVAASKVRAIFAAADRDAGERAKGDPKQRRALYEDNLRRAAERLGAIPASPDEEDAGKKKKEKPTKAGVGGGW